jgi:hypothetical protein
MPSKRRSLLLLLLAALLALPASAQVYQWKDASGKTIISDKPPPGQLPVPKRSDDASATEVSPTQPSLADRELEFRKRRQEAQESAEKSEKEAAASAEKEENCQAAQRQLQSLESGERIALRDDKGGRYFMDDARRAQEMAKVKQFIDTQCQ